MFYSNLIQIILRTEVEIFKKYFLRPEICRNETYLSKYNVC